MTEAIIPCFTPGTMIATPRGEVGVERLRVDDTIITRDNGIQAIRWMGTRKLSWTDLASAPHLRPVRISIGAFGHGVPERDLLVSPNRRVLVTSDRTALHFVEPEVLVAAKHLVTGQRVTRITSAGVTYIHFMFARHEVVLSDGAWTESFQPADRSLKGIGNAQRNELYELFPALAIASGAEDYPAARRSSRQDARQPAR